MVLKLMPTISDLGSFLLQIFLDFDLQSLIISLQVPHPLQVGGQVVIQVLHGFLLTLDPPMPARPPANLVARPLDPQLPCWLVEWDTEIQEPEPPGVCIDAGGCTAHRWDPVVGQLHRAQGTNSWRKKWSGW